jgi:hypothetical protein
MPLPLIRTLAAVLVGTGLASPRAFAQTVDSDSTVGLALATGRNSGCLGISNDHLAPGSTIVLVSPRWQDVTPKPRVGVAEVEAKLGEACDVDLGEYGDSYYRIHLNDSTKVRYPYFALTTKTRPVVGRDGTIRSDVGHGGVHEEFRVCTSPEGLHFTIWSGKPLKSTRRFHAYFPLRYDVEPSCTEADY